MGIETANPPLQVRAYGVALGDYQLVNEWWQSRHGEPLAETLLPPCGVIVEREGEPIAALWCYHCYGVGVAFLEMPITRPGSYVSASMEALGLAVEACVTLVKAAAQAEGGDVCLFKCYTLPGIARMLPRLGFTKCTEAMEGFILRKD